MIMKKKWTICTNCSLLCFLCCCLRWNLRSCLSTNCWRICWDLSSISSTFYARILCTKVLLYVRQTQNVIRKSCAKHFCMQKLLIKRWWNWHLVSISKISFCTPRSQKRKNTVKSSIFFALLGSASVKAAHRMLIKLTPNVICNMSHLVRAVFFNLFQVAEPFKNYWVFGGT
jgi:hypothetical protein